MQLLVTYQTLQRLQITYFIHQQDQNRSKKPENFWLLI